MSLTTMYPGFVNSPSTVLTSGISDSDTTISVSELSVFPATPNIAVLGIGDDTETILYTQKSGTSGSGTLSGITREYNKTGTFGAKKAWLSGTSIRRAFTEYDYKAVTVNMSSHAHDGIDGTGGSCRRDTSTNLNSIVLPLGVFGWTTDTHVLKIGDGTTVFTDLPFVNWAASGALGFIVEVTDPINESGVPSSTITAIDVTDEHMTPATVNTSVPLTTTGTTGPNWTTAVDCELTGA